MNNCFHMWVQTGRLSDEEYKCLKCGEQIAYRKVDRHNAEPPARKPLTDEQISAIVQSMSAYTWDAHMFARAIERAHGIQ